MNAHVQLAEIARIAEQLSVLCDDDEQLFHDMLQGESDIDRIVSRIHEQIARDQRIRRAGCQARARDPRAGRREAQVRDHGTALLGEPGHVQRRHLEAIDVRGHGEDRRHRGDAGAADPGQKEVRG